MDSDPVLFRRWKKAARPRPSSGVVMPERIGETFATRISGSTIKPSSMEAVS